MGRDNQPKHRRQARVLKRRAVRRAPYERLLIVCEGEKTEPLYINEIRRDYRLASANVQVRPSVLGTQPLQVVEYAEHLFRNGDRARQIEPRAFDRVFTVFDRDDHRTYHAALAKADELDNSLTNDEGKRIPVAAIASVPCFELWLLLHFEDVLAPMHRLGVLAALKKHLSGYDKGQAGNWDATKARLDTAIQRAQAKANTTGARDGTESFTNMHELVLRLVQLKD